MSNTVYIPVVLAGGFGERLWPLSRTTYPKQFINLFNSEYSLFQTTVARTKQFNNFLPPIVVCHEEHRFIAAEQLRMLGLEYSALLVEPKANNTAPAITLAALWAEDKFAHQEIIFAVFPSDHLLDATVLSSALESATRAALNGKMVTFGIKPNSPETGYGYIKAGLTINDETDFAVRKVEKFVEKPDLDTAKKFVASNDYFWNSGMFVFKTSNFLHEIKQFEPDILEVVSSSLAKASKDLTFIRPDHDIYSTCKSLSIDYAVMEHTDDAAVIALDAHWSDVGSWEAVWQQGSKDENLNSYQGDVVCIDSKDCLIDARSRLVATLGVENLAVVETKDAVLITKKDSSQHIKKIVNVLKTLKHPTTSEHREVMRPWGWYQSIAKGNNFQVKHIFVHPGASLSLQLHKYRSEHWIIVKGSAKVVRGTEEFMLTSNESTFIPVGTKHQLCNINTEPLELIEVQSGSYLGEDDIVRFEDEHGRITQGAST